MTSILLAVASAGPVPPTPTPPNVDREAHNGLIAGIKTWQVMMTVSEPEPAWLVILWGSRDEAEAWAWLDRYAAAGGRMRERYPYVADSTWFGGLQPGFFVVVAAQPDDEATAKAVAARYRAGTVPGVDLTGTYVKQAQAANLAERGLDPSTVGP